MDIHKQHRRKNWSYDLILASVMDEFRDIEDFISEVSQSIDIKIKEIENFYSHDKRTCILDDDSESELLTMLVDDAFRYNNIFTKYHYNSMLLSIFNVFEYWLRRFCDIDSKKNPSKIKISDLKGNNGAIEPSRKYLSLVAEIDLKDTDDMWRKITEVQKIRNAITHHNSSVKTDNSKPLEKQFLYQLVLTDDKINFRPPSSKFFIQDKQYLFDAIELFKNYLRVIVSKLKNRNVIAKNSVMPFNNDIWGVEKSFLVLAEILDNYYKIKKTSIENKDELLYNLNNALTNASKIYAFFCNAEWDPNHVELLIQQSNKGLEYIKNFYNKNIN